MDYYAMFERGIENDRQMFTAHVKNHGRTENMTDNLFGAFRERVNECPELKESQKMVLIAQYSKMLESL